MVKTNRSAYITSNLLVPICDCFQLLSANKNDYLKLIKPDTMIFYMVLDACVRFKLSFKDQLITELILVVAEAHSITIIAHVHDAHPITMLVC